MSSNTNETTTEHAILRECLDQCEHLTNMISRANEMYGLLIRKCKSQPHFNGHSLQMGSLIDVNEWSKLNVLRKMLTQIVPIPDDDTSAETDINPCVNTPSPSNYHDSYKVHYESVFY